MLPEPVQIVANEGAPISYPIFAEVVLDAPLGATFDQIAAADADGDGRVTVAELGVDPDEDQCDSSTGCANRSSTS